MQKQNKPHNVIARLQMLVNNGANYGEDLGEISNYLRNFKQILKKHGQSTCFSHSMDVSIQLFEDTCTTKQAMDSLQPDVLDSFFIVPFIGKTPPQGTHLMTAVIRKNLDFGQEVFRLTMVNTGWRMDKQGHCHAPYQEYTIRKPLDLEASLTRYRLSFESEFYDVHPADGEMREEIPMHKDILDFSVPLEDIDFDETEDEPSFLEQIDEAKFKCLYASPTISEIYAGMQKLMAVKHVEPLPKRLHFAFREQNVANCFLKQIEHAVRFATATPQQIHEAGHGQTPIPLKFNAGGKVLDLAEMHLAFMDLEMQRYPHLVPLIEGIKTQYTWNKEFRRKLLEPHTSVSELRPFISDAFQIDQKTVSFLAKNETKLKEKWMHHGEEHPSMQKFFQDNHTLCLLFKMSRYFFFADKSTPEKAQLDFDIFQRMLQCDNIQSGQVKYPAFFEQLYQDIATHVRQHLKDTLAMFHENSFWQNFHAQYKDPLVAALSTAKILEQKVEASLTHHEKQQRYEIFIQRYETAFLLSPEHAVIKERLAQAYFRYAEYLSTERNMNEEAVGFYHRAKIFTCDSEMQLTCSLNIEMLISDWTHQDIQWIPEQDPRFAKIAECLKKSSGLAPLRQELVGLKRSHQSQKRIMDGAKQQRFKTIHLQR